MKSLSSKNCRVRPTSADVRQDSNIFAQNLSSLFQDHYWKLYLCEGVRILKHFCCQYWFSPRAFPLILLIRSNPAYGIAPTCQLHALFVSAYFCAGVPFVLTSAQINHFNAIFTKKLKTRFVSYFQFFVHAINQHYKCFTSHSLSLIFFINRYNIIK